MAELWRLAEQTKKNPCYTADKGTMSHAEVLRLFPCTFQLEQWMMGFFVKAT